MKKLPIGIQSFASIRDGGYCYVDKGALIHQLVENGKYYFLSRPRRFGKSLLVDTLAQAFMGKRSLFEGLYLDQHWDWSVSHPVIRFDFSSGVLTGREALDAEVLAQLQECAQGYGVEVTENAPHRVFSSLIHQLYQKSGQRVVVLVDEYDKPILDNIASPEQAAELREGLKNIYSVIKSRDAELRFVLLTGVSKFSKVSLFSGLNNLKDITLDSRYATICGYTERDLSTVFAEHLQGVDRKELRSWYNGYNFLGEKVYNPYDVLLYLDERTFRSYWFETGNPSFLLELLQQRSYPIPQLENLRADDDLLASFDVESLEIETLLFQTGYLTIQEMEQLGGARFFTLGYPNMEVKSALTNHILNMLVSSSVKKTKGQQSLYYALQRNDLDGLHPIFHAFFASIPHDWYRKNQLANYEGYYASIVYCYFAALGLDVTPEETTNHGRIDLTVKFEDRVYLIEFKVNEMTEAGSALAQIKERGYHEKFADSECYLIGIEFSREDRNITAFAWEQA